MFSFFSISNISIFGDSSLPMAAYLPSLVTFSDLGFVILCSDSDLFEKSSKHVFRVLSVKSNKLFEINFIPGL